MGPPKEIRRTAQRVTFVDDNKPQPQPQPKERLITAGNLWKRLGALSGSEILSLFVIVLSFIAVMLYFILSSLLKSNLQVCAESCESAGLVMHEFSEVSCKCQPKTVEQE